MKSTFGLLNKYNIAAKELLDRMIAQGAKSSVSNKMILKIMSKHPEDFIQFKMDHNEILKSLYCEWCYLYQVLCDKFCPCLFSCIYFGKKVNCERVGLCAVVWGTTSESWASNPEVRDFILILYIKI